MPTSDIATPYSITSSARVSRVGGTFNAKRFSGFEVHYQFELCRLFDRPVGRLGSL
jgi:hypothetical protein